MTADTITAYRSHLKQYSLFLEGAGIKRIDAVDAPTIGAYMKYMREEAVGRGGKKGLAGATIARRLASVSSFYDFLKISRKRVVVNPVENFSLRRTRNDKPKPIDPSVIEKLFETIDSERDRILFKLFLATGLRVSEMAQLNKTSIVTIRTEDRLGKVVTIGEGEVLGKGQKIRKFYATVKMMRWLAEYKSQRKDDNPALFISERKQRMSVRAMQERLAYWCERSGVIHANVHQFRHTFGTQMANADMDVLQLRDIMGHESIQTTMQYIKLTDRTVSRGYHAAMEGLGGDQ